MTHEKNSWKMTQIGGLADFLKAVDPLIKVKIVRG